MKVVCINDRFTFTDAAYVLRKGGTLPVLNQIYEVTKTIGTNPESWECKEPLAYVISLLHPSLGFDPTLFREIDEPENESVEETNTTSCPATSPLI